jgi:hypothetical protein
VRYAAITIEYLTSAPVMVASPAARCAWLMLQGYVALRETGGVIAGAATWGDLEWKMVMGRGGSRRALDEVISAGLARFDGPDLTVMGYDIEAEIAYDQKRGAASRGGKARAENFSRRNSLKTQGQALSGATGAAISDAGSDKVEQSKAKLSEAKQSLEQQREADPSDDWDGQDQLHDNHEGGANDLPF